MNAKELIQAAKDATGFVNATRESELMTHEDAVLRIAHHILATVREDDDEPVTPEWVALNMLDSETEFADLSIKRCNFLDGDFWINDDQMEGNKILFCWQDSPPTRGQLRKLLESLGVQ